MPGLSDLAAAVALLAELDKDVAPALFGNILPNTALGGARPKLTIAHAGHQWIGKFPSREDPVGAPKTRVECAMLSLARACGIEAVDSTVVTVDDQDILLVKRFDRTAARSVGGHEGGWFRDAYLSARTLFHAKPELQTYSFAASYPRVATEFGTWSAWPAADRAQLFRRMVFNCLTSNTDDHDRNHGVVTDDVTGGYRLAPAFDLVPRVHRTARREQAMDVGEEGAVGSLENVLSACRAFGLTRGAAAVIADETASSVRRLWRERFAANGLSEEVMERYAGCFGAWSAERPADAPALGDSDGRVPPIG